MRKNWQNYKGNWHIRKRAAMIKLERQKGLFEIKQKGEQYCQHFMIFI